MANEATATDQYVRREIEKFGVRYDEQGSSHPEIAKALKGASKQGKSGVGKPEFVMQILDYLIVIEDKRDSDKLIKLTEDGSIAKDIPSLSGFAVNGAVHYANHIVTKTSSFDEVIAIGITGDEEFHSIQPILVSITEEGITEKELPKLTDLQELHPNNINEWYSVNVLNEYSIEQKRIFELQNVSKELHEDLRNYASLEGENKATVISAILLALNEEDFDIKKLTGNKYPKKTDGTEDKTRPAIDNDGMRILKAVKDYIASEGVMPEDKVNILLNKFSFLATNVRLNEKNETLGVTPLHYFTKKLQDKVIHHFKQNTDYDILGNFYGEFVKYGGSDGNGLGIVLTPHHITTLMTELINVLPTDYVLDPACGSGAFLISAMNRMTKLAKDEDEIKHIKQHQLLGIELQEKMFTVATTNMILRGDGKSNLQLNDMFSVTGEEIQKQRVNKILFNPPYSQGKTDKTLTEINFIRHALDMLVTGGKLAVIVPQSTMVGKSKEEKEYKKKILEKHTLDIVITVNKDTFHGVGTNPVIAVFEAGKPHDIDRKKVKFINFEEDGFVVRKHIGLVDDGNAKERRRYLFDVINGDEENYTTKFMVKSTIQAEDEWLHSFYYFNDEIPSAADFEKTIADYLSFQFDMYAHGRGYLFEVNDDKK
ncbi:MULTISPECIES: class I SAM-dependent DNA methyltransferase [Streptococcus]|uniref:site-specific DNA-methyltransferase (adenine-specific) n=1 Tax=Streptococcus mitis TaxID=28037 RepID=A0A150NTK9_STRMT|nr:MULTISPECIES: N-6 DNA methylase [Streptococcus]KYF34475.1 Type I restriction-modification system, DNA-methyltransferase subunit M [Streptococcus mitis]KYF36807.1 Type I restriction-modification system, DNA-methyltransferase subunit M [Streptococcus mitis]MBT2164657.1 N-6 DNA methylase [Streptococcus mitis]OFN91553.1 adenine methyltransferase [Streptococcus sp. HMSC077D04]QKL33536.1 N-6 DNA methylase [Streptococcus mitis]